MHLKLTIEEDLVKRLNAAEEIFDFDYHPENWDQLEVHMNWDDLRIPIELNLHYWSGKWESFKPDGTSKWNVEEYRVGEVE